MEVKKNLDHTLLCKTKIQHFLNNFPSKLLSSLKSSFEKYIGLRFWYICIENSNWILNNSNIYFTDHLAFLWVKTIPPSLRMMELMWIFTNPCFISQQKPAMTTTVWRTLWRTGRDSMENTSTYWPSWKRFYNNCSMTESSIL